MTIDKTQPCLCGSGQSYADCCGLFHDTTRLPASAEALMRSRFSAYALKKVDYLLSSWSESTRPADIDFSKETAQWQSLQIIARKKGGPMDAKGVVEFKAFYCQDGIACFMHEISRFVKTDQRWQYLDGVIKATGKVETDQSAGRNSLCACGSGKKFKRCCGK
ncbi:MAG: YchJ family protein [Methylomonas sp.]|jgi:SEC-C motif-containing protein|uniref:YchJ family protein n=1 Tax=Methylomonas sp. TaxID=418 RepID=UPI0025DEDF13|nr:YchJ family protein [Methylomonas sp.]MCK9606837.1 YchJ family protein [Methylomonas sp.]